MDRRTTRVIAVDPQRPDPAAVAEAAAIIRAGGLVAFPTETVYGLGADATSESAVRSIFAAKERALDDPVIVHVNGREALAGVVRGDLPPDAELLAAALWPGPLTLVLTRGDGVATAVSGGLETVAVRVPSHAVARALIEAARVPIAAPSANRFTRTSATTAAHVLEDLDGRIDLVLDGGPADAGVESTVVTCTSTGAVVLRPGAVTVEQLAGVLGYTPPIGTARGSPGTMLKHYAPRTRLIVFAGEGAPASLRMRALEELTAGRRVGLLVFEEDLAPPIPGATVEPLGGEADLTAAARHLFAGLRALDSAGLDVILARFTRDEGLGRAINDRLRRAATEVVNPGGTGGGA